MIRFCTFFGCIILSLPGSLLAQKKSVSSTTTYEVAPFLVKDDADTNLMNRYLIMSAKNFSDKPEIAIKYLDSAFSLGADYGTADQWIYIKINRCRWEAVNGNTDRAESMLNEIPTLLAATANPRLHGFYYYTLSELEKKKNNSDLYFSHSKKAISYYETVNDHFQIGKIRLYNAGFLQGIRATPQEALLEYEKALKHFEIVGEEKFINTCHRAMAVAYNFEGRHEEAIATFHKVIRSSESLGDDRVLAQGYFDLANVYINLEEFQKAIECYQKSIVYAEKIENKTLLAYNYSMIGSVLLSEGEATDSVISYQEKALNLFKDVKLNKGIMATSVSLSQSYTRHGDYRKAYRLITEAFQSSAIYQMPNYLAPAYGIYADLLLEAKDEVPEISRLPNRDSVINLYLDSCRYLEEQIGNPSSQIRFWHKYILAQKKMGNYKAAYESYEILNRLEDSVQNIDKKTEIIRLETEFKYAKQQDSLRYINQLAQEQLEKQHLLGLQQEQQFLLLYSESELRRINLLHTETDLNLQKEQGENLQRMLTIARQEQQLKQASLDEATKENELQKLRLRQQWIIGLMLIGGILSWAAFFFYRNKNKQNRIKLELERQVSDAMLKSLHAQMNPHFIFNSLASVKSYIAGEEPKRATNYLNNFAALIRRILHSSQEGTITFEEELETIRIYLRLEQERFKDRFSFTINWLSGLKAGETKVPALFLQPYVENAVWHGIMPLKTQGEIEVKIFDKEQHLIVQVIDNGIGIDGLQKKPYEPTQNKRKSYGMKLSQQRLAQFWGADTFVTLKNREGKQGAVLTIVIPQKSIKYGTTR